MTTDQRIFAPATARNREAIHDCLKNRLPEAGTILEIASGSGEHGHYLTPFFPALKWQPTNLLQEQLESVEAWREHESRPNFLPALQLDATAPRWPVEEGSYSHTPINAIFNANMIHIAPWFVCEGLMQGAGRVLGENGLLFLYGPFKENGHHTAPSNEKFEIWLTDQNQDFGIRDIEAVSEEAAKSGLTLIESCPMPANNFIQIFQKTP